MKTLIVWKLLCAACICAATQVALASGFPECRDDECTEVKQHLLKNVFLPLVQLGRLSDESEVEKFIQIKNYPYTKKEIIDRGEVIWKWPRREFSESAFLKGKLLSIEISIEAVCIRRAEIENVFNEPWLVGQTPGQWFARDRIGQPDRRHNGVMSFREGQAFRYSFGFRPSGCARGFSIFAG